MLSVPHPGCKCCYQIRSGIPRPSILLTDCMKEREGHKLFARYRGSFAGPPTIPLFVLLVLKRGMWRERPGLFCGKCCPFTSKKKYYSLSSTKLTREVLRRVTEAEERMGTWGSDKAGISLPYFPILFLSLMLPPLSKPLRNNKSLDRSIKTQKAGWRAYGQ